MAGWHDFYQMIGATAATLLGLLFVSVSLNAETIMGPEHVHSRRIAEQAFQSYLALVFVSLMVFFPRISVEGFAQSLLWFAGIFGGWTIIRTVQVVRHPSPGQSMIRSLRRYLPSLIGFAMLFLAGLEMLFMHNDESITCGVASMLLLGSATVVSWELLINIAAERYGPHH
ncbi:MAG TPA: hypothetical protein VGU69_01980 [Rhizomicrobium sp.]|nr:hypothetical protein [Rhizomicrobium sp.]